MINTLPDENDRNALLAAITLYQFNGQLPPLSPTLNLIFLFIKKEIDCIVYKLQAEATKKEARRLKRLAKLPGSATKEPQSRSRKPDADAHPDTIIEKSTSEINPQKPDNPAAPDTQPEKPTKPIAPEERDKPVVPTHQSEEPMKAAAEKSLHPLTKNKPFNALLRAKERHDRNRKTPAKNRRN